MPGVRNGQLLKPAPSVIACVLQNVVPEHQIHYEWVMHAHALLETPTPRS